MGPGNMAHHPPCCESILNCGLHNFVRQPVLRLIRTPVHKLVNIKFKSIIVSTSGKSPNPFRKRHR